MDIGVYSYLQTGGLGKYNVQDVSRLVAPAKRGRYLTRKYVLPIVLSLVFHIFRSLFGEKSSPFWLYKELRASPWNRGQWTWKSIVRSRSMVFKVLSFLDGPLLKMHTLGSKLPLICLTLESLQHGLQIVYYCYCKSLEQQRAISLVYTRHRNFLKTRRELRKMISTRTR